MAHGVVAGGGAGEGQRQHHVVEQGDDPTHGAHEVVAVRGPALGARPLDGGDEAGKHVGQQVGHGRCRDVLGGEDVLDALHLATFEVFRGKPLAAREADGGLGGIAVRIEGDLRGRALVFLDERLGGVGHAVGHDDQTARAGVDFDGLEGDARVGKGRGHHFLQLLVRGIKVERGDFLDADLECEGMRVRHATPLSFPCRPLRRRSRPWRPQPRRRPPHARCSTRSSPSPSNERAGYRPCAQWRK